MAHSPPNKPAHLNIRAVPREMLVWLKMAAAAERRSIKSLVIELIQAKIDDLETRGVLPKRK